MNPFGIDVFHLFLWIFTLSHLACCPTSLTCVNWTNRALVPSGSLLDLVSVTPQKKIQGREESKVGYLFPDSGWLGHLINWRSMLLSNCLLYMTLFFHIPATSASFCPLKPRDGKNSIAAVTCASPVPATPFKLVSLVNKSSNYPHWIVYTLDVFPFGIKINLHPSGVRNKLDSPMASCLYWQSFSTGQRKRMKENNNSSS